VTVAVNVTGLPTAGLALTVKLTVGAVPAILTVLDEGVVAEFASVTVRVTVFEPLLV